MHQLGSVQTESQRFFHTKLLNHVVTWSNMHQLGSVASCCWKYQCCYLSGLVPTSKFRTADRPIPTTGTRPPATWIVLLPPLTIVNVPSFPHPSLFTIHNPSTIHHHLRMNTNRHRSLSCQRCGNVRSAPGPGCTTAGTRTGCWCGVTHVFRCVCVCVCVCV
jgi:hypothetical protein